MHSRWSPDSHSVQGEFHAEVIERRNLSLPSGSSARAEHSHTVLDHIHGYPRTTSDSSRSTQWTRTNDRRWNWTDLVLRLRRTSTILCDDHDSSADPMEESNSLRTFDSQQLRLSSVTFHRWRAFPIEQVPARPSSLVETPSRPSSIDVWPCTSHRWW